MIRYWMCICLWMVIVTDLFGQEDSLYLQRRSWTTGSREQVPEWVIHPNQGNGVVGVSDPGLRPEMARGQALLRAWMLHLLQQGVEIAMVKDLYVNNEIRYDYEQSQEKLVLLASLKSPVRELTLRTGREWTSQYGECFLETFAVEGGPVANDSLFCIPAKDSAGVVGEMMFVSNNTLREQQEIRVEWMLHCPMVTPVMATDFLLRGNNEYKGLARSINGWKFAAKDRGRFWFQDSGVKPEEGVTFCQLNDAFWCAQAESMLYALMTHSFPEVELGNLDEKFGQQRKELQREVVRANVSLSVQEMCISNNGLYVNWNIRNIVP